MLSKSEQIEALKAQLADTEKHHAEVQSRGNRRWGEIREYFAGLQGIPTIGAVDQITDEISDYGFDRRRTSELAEEFNELQAKIECLQKQPEKLFSFYNHRGPGQELYHENLTAHDLYKMLAISKYIDLAGEMAVGDKIQWTSGEEVDYWTTLTRTQ